MARLNFGQLLRQRRVRRGWTQEQVAARAGLSPRYVQSLEANTKSPSLETVFKIARAFNTSPGPLLHPLWRDWRERPDPR